MHTQMLNCLLNNILLLLRRGAFQKFLVQVEKIKLVGVQRPVELVQSVVVVCGLVLELVTEKVDNIGWGVKLFMAQ